MTFDPFFFSFELWTFVNQTLAQCDNRFTEIVRKPILDIIKIDFFLSIRVIF